MIKITEEKEETATPLDQNYATGFGSEVKLISLIHSWTIRRNSWKLWEKNTLTSIISSIHHYFAWRSTECKYPSTSVKSASSGRISARCYSYTAGDESNKRPCKLLTRADLLIYRNCNLFLPIQHPLYWSHFSIRAHPPKLRSAALSFSAEQPLLDSDNPCRPCP